MKQEPDDLEQRASHAFDTSMVKVGRLTETMMIVLEMFKAEALREKRYDALLQLADAVDSTIVDKMEELPIHGKYYPHAVLLNVRPIPDWIRKKEREEEKRRKEALITCDCHSGAKKMDEEREVKEVEHEKAKDRLWSRISLLQLMIESHVHYLESFYHVASTESLDMMSHALDRQVTQGIVASRGRRPARNVQHVATLVTPRHVKFLPGEKQQSGTRYNLRRFKKPYKV
jgi:hypothetical protein